MVIILEGNEAVFKTTVAEKLSQKLNIPIVKGSSFQLSQCTNEQLFAHFKKLAKADDIILDRFIFSNRTYATLYKDYAILTDQQRREIEEMMKFKATLYYLFADDEVIKQRIDQRGDDYVNTDMVEKISDTYIQVISDAGLKKVAYDTEEWNSDEIVEDIVKDYWHSKGRDE